MLVIQASTCRVMGTPVETRMNAGWPMEAVLTYVLMMMDLTNAIVH